MDNVKQRIAVPTYFSDTRRRLLDHRWQPDDIEALWRPRHGLALLHQALDCAADTRLVQTLKLDGLLRVPVCGVGAMAMVS